MVLIFLAKRQVCKVILLRLLDIVGLEVRYLRGLCLYQPRCNEAVKFIPSFSFLAGYINDTGILVHI